MKHSSLKASNSHHACTSLRCHRPCRRLRLFWTSAIDVATGSLLVTEAGGVVSDIDGNAWNSDSRKLAVVGPGYL